MIVEDYENHEGISGHNFRDTPPKKIYRENFQSENKLIGEEIVNRQKDFWGTGIINGFAVTPSATAGAVDIANGVVYDAYGRRVAGDDLQALACAAGKNVIVVRHRWFAETYESLGEDGQNSEDRKNSFEYIARAGDNATAVFEEGDVKLFEVNNDAGVVSVDADLREFVNSFLKKDYSNFDSGYIYPGYASSDISLTMPDSGPWLVIVNAMTTDSGSTTYSRILIRENNASGAIRGKLEAVQNLASPHATIASGSGVVNSSTVYIDFEFTTPGVTTFTFAWLKLPNNVP